MHIMSVVMMSFSGGFLMVKPSEAVFEEYIDIILEGDYREGQGWGGKYGYFFGKRLFITIFFVFRKTMLTLS